MALVRDGDPIKIDIPSGILDLEVPEKELEKRKVSQEEREHSTNTHGRKFLARYSQLVSGADKGAVLETFSNGGGGA